MAYHVVISQFEGPLDLLLHLITEAQIDIRDLFIYPIVEQFLETFSQMGVDDMDRASEFLAMAARLVEIKSRKLLPAEDEEELTEALEDEAQLVRQLEELRRFRQAREVLTEMEKEAGRIYYRLPDERFTHERFQADAMSLEALLEAFNRIRSRLERTEEPAEPDAEVERDRFTIEERRLFLAKKLLPGKPLLFSTLFGRRVTRAEIVSTFVVLLELVWEGRIAARQEGEDVLLLPLNIKAKDIMSEELS
ncbi:MAG: segregation and condensation protein A [Christensenellales bacterium]